VEVLCSRILLHPVDLARSRHFYRDVLGLAVYREFGSLADPSVVFFLGGGGRMHRDRQRGRAVAPGRADGYAFRPA